MGKRIDTEMVINAAPEKVWSVLMDFAAYPQWNPFIISLAGSAAPGEQLTVTLKLKEGKPMVIKPVVQVAATGRELRWRGRLLITGIFDGEHSFVLQDNGNGTTTFVHSEQFSGILVPFMARMLDVDTLNAFKEMNLALKGRVEGEEAS